MHFSFSIVNDILIKPLCLGVLLFCSYGCDASASATALDKVLRNLPDLSEGDAAPGHFDWDEQSVALGYDGRRQKWGARLDEYLDINRSITFDYGRLLTNTFGAGGTFTHQSGYSEVLVNGVYAPKSNVRVRLSGGQLRTFGDDSYGLGSGSDTVLQNSYLLDVRKYWSKSWLLSDLGVATYAVEANAPDYTDLSALTSAGMSDADDIDSSQPALGRLNGYMLKIGLQPSSRSRIELRRETGYLTYRLDDGVHSVENLVSSRIKYTQYLKNCTRLQGSYSASADSDRLDLGIARNSWNINLSRALDNGSSDTAIQIGYVLPLGRLGYRARDCGSNLESVRLFEPIVDTTIKRPQQFPREPLTKPAI